MNSRERPERFADVRRHLKLLGRCEGLAGVVEAVLAYPKIRKAFSSAAGESNPFDEVAKILGLSIELEGFHEGLPPEGPVVFVANHGHGGADALALMAIMSRFRSDVRVLANREVSLLDGLEPFLFPVSLLNGPDARENIRSLRAMLKHVQSGGCLGVFPAGRVAYWKGDRMADPPWNDHVIKLLQKMKATIVPVWFYGNPPAAICLLSRMSPFLRTALIPTGLAWMKGRTIRVRAGKPFASGLLKDQGENAAVWMRANLQSLRDAGN
jgi:putative hemolysin